MNGTIVNIQEAYINIVHVAAAITIVITDLVFVLNVTPMHTEC